MIIIYTDNTEPLESDPVDVSPVETEPLDVPPGLLELLEETESSAETPVDDPALDTDNLAAIHEELVMVNEKLDAIVQIKDNDSLPIWEKQLADYSTGEALGLLTLFLLVGIVIFKLIGGIIRCSL